MYVLNITTDYDYIDHENNENNNVTNYKHNENEDVNIIIKYLILSIPSSIILLLVLLI